MLFRLEPHKQQNLAWTMATPEISDTEVKASDGTEDVVAGPGSACDGGVNVAAEQKTAACEGTSSNEAPSIARGESDNALDDNVRKDL